MSDPIDKDTVEAWAAACAREGSPLPLELLRRIDELDVVMRRAQRLCDLYVRPGCEGMGPRLDELRERLGERRTLLLRRIGRTVRALDGLRPGPLLTYVFTHLDASRTVSSAQSTMRNESLHRRLARERRLRARASGAAVAGSSGSSCIDCGRGVALPEGARPAEVVRCSECGDRAYAKIRGRRDVHP